ncbi:MAG: BMP family ABC transporter substrate-binding protein [Clostridiales Family XIII bacterium]|jgi:basic membrane protein A|nr:BMP family ABC transporter substrate-binding protein [Clostridiales Family XIII bacterium]
MKKLLALALALAMALTVSACQNSPKSGAGSAEGADDALTVGFIYIGNANDGGYTQAHHNGAVAMEEYFEGKVKTLVMEEISDTDKQAIRSAADSLIDQGATVVVGTSFGFGDTLYEMAQSGDYDGVKFLHFSGNLMADNMGNYFGATEEPRYLTGIIAGLQTKTNKLGYVGAYPYTEVQIGINAFTLGAQSVNPDVEVNVVYINSWYDPAKESQAAEALLDQGCDVIAQHCDTTGPQLAAEKAGALAIGYNLDNPTAAPGAWLTAPIWRHEAFLIPTIEKIMAGSWTPESYYGTMKDGYMDIAKLSSLVSPEAQAAVEQVKEKMLAGEFHVFTGPIQDNKGNTVVQEGETLYRDGIWKTDYLVQGASSADI